MKCRDLIKLLVDLPPETIVLVDVTPNDAEVFHFVSIEACDTIKTDDGRDFIVITPGTPDTDQPSPSLN